MNSEINQDVAAKEVAQEVAEEIKAEVKAKDLESATPLLSDDSSTGQKIADRVSAVLSDLPDYLQNIFSNYRKPLISLGLVFGAIIAARTLLAVLSTTLDVVDDVPLLAATFELIGIGYSAWFIYRYLLKASDRQELVDQFEKTRQRILGGNQPEA
jgi:hypothetical protein